jgi:hypothetical protein
MATTITPSTLTVKITESISLNGRNQGSSNTLSIDSINEVYKRIVSCPANSETTIAHFHSSVADGTLSPLDMESLVIFTGASIVDVEIFVASV